MKENIHPQYNKVVFRDKSADYMFLTKSTKSSDEKIMWEDGSEYPVIDIEISSASHPFYTGGSKIVDTEGRVAKFNKKYGKE